METCVYQNWFVSAPNNNFSFISKSEVGENGDFIILRESLLNYERESDKFGEVLKYVSALFISQHIKSMKPLTKLHKSYFAVSSKFETLGNKVD